MLGAHDISLIPQFLSNLKFKKAMNIKEISVYYDTVGGTHNDTQGVYSALEAGLESIKVEIADWNFPRIKFILSE